MGRGLGFKGMLRSGLRHLSGSTLYDSVWNRIGTQQILVRRVSDRGTVKSHNWLRHLLEAIVTSHDC